jgi:toxin ParE1/3/4
MISAVSVHEIAETEINEAADFYDLESPGFQNSGPTPMTNGPVGRLTETTRRHFQRRRAHLWRGRPRPRSLPSAGWSQGGRGRPPHGRMHPASENARQVLVRTPRGHDPEDPGVLDPHVRSPGLGNVFINEIERALESISEFPGAAPLIRGRIRKRIVAMFPYALVYSIRGNEIRILAAAHQQRRPFYWRGRR